LGNDERSLCMMRAKWLIATLVLAALAAAAGCAGDADKAIVRMVDKEGNFEPRVITVDYVNQRLDRMPPHLVPDVPGEEGKRQFVEEIVRKELLVVKGAMMGLDKDPYVDQLREFYGKDKSRSMYLNEMIYDGAEPSEQDIEDYNILRETNIAMLQIVVDSKDVAMETHRRVTEGGEEFSAVAREVSVAPTAEAGGKMEPKPPIDSHPIVAMHIWDKEKGEVTEPFPVGAVWHIYKIVGRKSPSEVPELDEARMPGVKMETRTWKRTLAETRFTENLRQEIDVRYSDEAMIILMDRMESALDRTVPENVEELSREERMEITRMRVLPEFDDDESSMELVVYNLGEEETRWTLGDFRDLLDEIPGIEGPKTSEEPGLKGFIWRNIMDENIEHRVGLKNYETTKELQDYVDMRAEEYLVNQVYATEVSGKIEQPSGEEIRTRFRENRERYAEPPKVDLKQIVVSNEAEANALRQRILSGEATFEELAEKHSMEKWSASRGGLIKNYYQGERRLEYLQDFVFDLEIGELSDPFPSTGGYAIVEVLAKYPRRLREMSELGDQVKQEIVAERTEARLKELLDEVREQVDIQWTEENLQYVKDTAEAVKEKRESRFVVTG